MIKSYFVTGIVLTGVLTAWMGCSSSSGSAGTGAGTTSGTKTTSHSSASGTASTGSAGGATTGTGAGSTTGSAGTASTGSTGAGGGAGGGSQGTGGASANILCTVPTPAPSKGACVTFTGVDGGEADGGLDNMGNASLTNCDPVTNAGCTGTDVCGLDASQKFYDCFPAGSPVIPLCGDCINAAQGAECGDGLLCVTFDQAQTVGYCTALCCTDADCGTGHTCDTMAFGPGNGLPNNVGICD